MRKTHFLLLLGVIIICMVLISSVSMPAILAFAAPTLSKAPFINAVVSTDKLNVRQGPSTTAPVLCVLDSGEQVEVYGRLGNWCLVYHPVKKCAGMVHCAYIKPVGQNTPGNGTQMPAPKPTTVPPAAKPTTKPFPSFKPVPTSMPAPSGGTSTIPNPVPSTGTGTPPPANTSLQPTSEETELMGYVNDARKSAGAGPLQFDPDVIKTARLKARDMVEKNYFSHQSPTYGSPFDMMRQFGVVFKTAGENIAGNSTVKGAFDAWMKSEGHRKNILNPSFNYAGYGIEPSPT